VTVIQRFNSALAASPHFHTLFLDGVYSFPPDTAGAESTTAVGKRDGATPTAVTAFRQDEPVGEDPAAQEGLDLGDHERWEHRRLAAGLELADERPPVGLEHLEQDGLFGSMALVFGVSRRAGCRAGARIDHAGSSVRVRRGFVRLLPA
jgi:hypothetical protein